MGHISNEGGASFKPVSEDTAEEFAGFLGDLKDTTEPEKRNNAWLRLWGQVKGWASYAVRKFSLHSLVSQEAISELVSLVMEVICKKISGYKIQSKEKPAWQFCAWAKAIVNRTWLKLTSRHKKRSEKAEQNRNELERQAADLQFMDPDTAAFPRQGVENLLGLLDKFAAVSEINKKMAAVLRQAIYLSEGEPEICSIRGLAMKLKIDHTGLTRYRTAFKEFIENTKRDSI
ncbi:MAG: hypothetical protein PHV33_13165 [Elusimicrobiales bacterium]|nr:hypothetical protein [Elusimicrobiales bacterium]